MSSTVFDNGTDRHNNRPTAKQTRQPNQALPMREFRQPFNVFTVVLLPRPFGPQIPRDPSRLEQKLDALDCRYGRVRIAERPHPLSPGDP